MHTVSGEMALGRKDQQEYKRIGTMLGMMATIYVLTFCQNRCLSPSPTSRDTVMCVHEGLELTQPYSSPSEYAPPILTDLMAASLSRDLIVVRV